MGEDDGISRGTRTAVVLLVLGLDHLRPVAVSPPPGSSADVRPTAVLVTHDLRAGADVSGSVATTAAAATCWRTALTRLGAAEVAPT